MINNTSPLSRISISLSRTQLKIPPKAVSYQALQNNNQIQNLSNVNRHKLAHLVKFISIATRESHQGNRAGVTITVDKVKQYLVNHLSLADDEHIKGIALNLINIANIESPKGAGFKEFFFRHHHTISQHAKDFITNPTRTGGLGLKLSEIELKSQDIDNSLRGNYTGNIALHLCHFFMVQIAPNDIKDTGTRSKKIIEQTIKNCSGLSSSGGSVRKPTEAISLLTQHKDIFDEGTFKSLVKTLIENCSGLSIYGGSVRKPTEAISLLTQHKGWLFIQENEFYQQQIIKLFKSPLTFINFTELLENHGENIAAEIILNKYRTTHSIDVINSIRGYVQGLGAGRRINLPPRMDMMVNGRPLAGIAFEVHNYTNGIEQTALEIVNSILLDSQEPIRNFNINDLREKFKLLDGDMQNKCEEALNKILESPDYKNKLEAALPALASFLNANLLLWEHDHNDDARSRWQLWLSQSFLEAGTAYSGESGASCVKGIYERLFTGFRTMHPGIDAIFAAKNILEGYKENIVNIMRDKSLVQNIVDELKKQKANPVDSNFNDQLKKLYAEKLREEISRQIHDSEEKLKEKLYSLPNTCTLINEYVKSNNKDLIDSGMNKFKDSIDNIEYITYSGDTTLDQHIKNNVTV